MEVIKFEFNYFGENTYIIWDSASHAAAIIDPGMIKQSECDTVDAFIASNNLSLKQILLTHAHLDHTFGVERIKEKYQVEVYAHKLDMPLAAIRQQQATMFHLPIKLQPLEIDKFVADGDEFTLGSETINVIHTPGHTQGGVCYYLPQSQMLFTGDTLFCGSIGRTDLPGGNHQQLINAVTSKIITLPPNTIVYPGHGPSTTIEREATANPYI